MKKIIFIFFICIMVFNFTGCDNNKEVEKEAKNFVDVFNSGDMSSINEIIFGKEVQENEMMEENKNFQEGVIETIFGYVTLEFKGISKNNIEYEIEYPDMHNIFVDIPDSMSNISEEELLKYISEYAKNATKETVTVSLEYSVQNNKEIIINYQNKEFINAMTGGFLDAYNNLYCQMLEYYVGEA